MKSATDLIDILATRAKRLPEARQREIAAALSEMLDEPYQLSPEELTILQPALDEALAGIGLTDAETDDLLSRSWA